MPLEELTDLRMRRLMRLRHDLIIRFQSCQTKIMAIILTSMNSYELVFWGQELQHARKTPAKGGREAPPFVDEAFFLHVAIIGPKKPARKNSYS